MTGGAKGIGYHTVKHLARLGMHVIIGTVIISKILIYIFCLFLKVFSVSFMQYFLSSISISMEEERWRGEESTFSTNENLIYILFCKILKKSVFFFLNTKLGRLEVLYVKSQQEGHGKDFKMWTLCK